MQQDMEAPHNLRTFAIAKMAKATHLLCHCHFITKNLTKLMASS